MSGRSGNPFRHFPAYPDHRHRGPGGRLRMDAPPAALAPATPGPPPRGPPLRPGARPRARPSANRPDRHRSQHSGDTGAWRQGIAPGTAFALRPRIRHRYRPEPAAGGDESRGEKLRGPIPAHPLATPVLSADTAVRASSPAISRSARWRQSTSAAKAAAPVASRRKIFSARERSSHPRAGPSGGRRAHDFHSHRAVRLRTRRLPAPMPRFEGETRRPHRRRHRPNTLDRAFRSSTSGRSIHRGRPGRRPAVAPAGEGSRRHPHAHALRGDRPHAQAVPPRSPGCPAAIRRAGPRSMPGSTRAHRRPRCRAGPRVKSSEQVGRGQF